MLNKCQITLVDIDGQRGGAFTCSTCGKKHTFLLKKYPKGSVFHCPCGFNVAIPLNEHEILAQIRQQMEKALKEGLKK